MNEITILGNVFDIIPIGDDKLLLQVNDTTNAKNQSIPLIGQTILNKQLSALENLVASETELLLYCHKKKHKYLLNKLYKIDSIFQNESQKAISIDVCFELGEDWERVSDYLERDREVIIKELLRKKYSLINYGFRPGFMYLDGLNEKCHVPRLDEPRLHVPAGCLAIGGKYLGIYGSDSPGGWNIIGRTPHMLKNIDLESLPNISQEIKFNRLTKDKYLRKHK